MDKNYDNHDILINFYYGHDGPTIRIDTRSVEHLAHVRDIFLGLASGELCECEFDGIESTKTVGMKGLLLTSTVQEYRQRLHLVQESPDGPLFHWRDSPGGWADAADFVSAMLEDPRPSHQYLTSVSADDALVIIALLET